MKKIEILRVKNGFTLDVGEFDWSGYSRPSLLKFVFETEESLIKSLPEILKEIADISGSALTSVKP